MLERSTRRPGGEGLEIYRQWPDLYRHHISLSGVSQSNQCLISAHSPLIFSQPEKQCVQKERNVAIMYATSNVCLTCHKLLDLSITNFLIGYRCV